jgi:hypothetical protein
MDQLTQTTHFANDLERLIDRYRVEYDLTYVDMVGVLHIQTFALCREAEKGAEERLGEDGLN